MTKKFEVTLGESVLMVEADDEIEAIRLARLKANVPHSTHHKVVCCDPECEEHADETADVDPDAETVDPETADPETVDPETPEDPVVVDTNPDLPLPTNPLG